MGICDSLTEVVHCVQVFTRRDGGRRALAPIYPGVVEVKIRKGAEDCDLERRGPQICFCGLVLEHAVDPAQPREGGRPHMAFNLDSFLALE